MNFMDRFAEFGMKLGTQRHMQTEIIQNEINGIPTPISLLMIYTQDHLMTAILAKELIEELILEKRTISKLSAAIAASSRC